MSFTEVQTQAAALPAEERRKLADSDEEPPFDPRLPLRHLASAPTPDSDVLLPRDFAAMIPLS